MVIEELVIFNIPLSVTFIADSSVFAAVKFSEDLVTLSPLWVYAPVPSTTDEFPLPPGGAGGGLPPGACWPGAVPEPVEVVAGLLVTVVGVAAAINCVVVAVAVVDMVVGVLELAGEQEANTTASTAGVIINFNPCLKIFSFIFSPFVNTFDLVLLH